MVRLLAASYFLSLGQRMAVYNTPSDAANTAVRVFLTSVGEFYYGATFNTGSGKNAKDVWRQIQQDFEFACAYCGASERLQVEHLVMFNRKEYGLHHPGNVVPVCESCNAREKNETKEYLSWRDHLGRKCGGTDTPAYVERLARIEAHIAKYDYPSLTTPEQNAIAVIAESLYENIKAESEKSLTMYKKLDRVFVTQTP
jgi:hypothetical protein